MIPWRNWALVGFMRFYEVFLKTFPYDLISKFQELEGGFYHSSVQSKLKICQTEFLQITL